MESPKSPQTQAVERMRVVAILRAAARDHKRLSGHHRRRAQELMAEAATVEHDEPEADSHGRPDPET